MDFRADKSSLVELLKLPRLFFSVGRGTSELELIPTPPGYTIAAPSRCRNMAGKSDSNGLDNAISIGLIPSAESSIIDATVLMNTSSGGWVA